MCDYKFTREGLVHHVETFGIDVRPGISLTEDRQHIQEIYNRLSESMPTIFESLTHGPQQFEIKTNIAVSGGKGKLEWSTFILTNRGPVFKFVRRHAGLDDDIDWPDLKSCVLDSMDVVKKSFPHLKMTRIGKVHELIFSTEKRSSDSILRDRFVPTLVDNVKGLEVHWNEGDEDYNRWFRLFAVRTKTVVAQTQHGVTVSKQQEEEYGIRVILDVNNANTEAALDRDDFEKTIDHADDIYKTRLPEVLGMDQ